jgi:hypothetical protein
MRVLSPLLLMLAWLPASAGSESAWQTQKERDGVQISTRAVEGWSIHEIRGVERIPARLSTVAAVLCDIDASTAINDLIVEAKVVQRDNDTRYRFYTAMKMPWPVSDRDLVNQRQITQDPASLAVTFDDQAVPEAAPPRKGYVRMEKSHQLWILTPANGEVLVEMRALSDPNGPIPAVIVNAMAVDAPIKSLVRLRELAASPKYAQAKLPFIKEPEPH